MRQAHRPGEDQERLTWTLVFATFLLACAAGAILIGGLSFGAPH